jgi:putative ATP-binding cassette transporter
MVGINARLNTWSRDFDDALKSRNVREFPQLIVLFAALAFAFIILAAYNGGIFYRVERDHRLADNPDQRIANLDVPTLA